MKAMFTTGYRIGGAITLVLGVAHFFLPAWGYGEALRAIPEVQRDHFVYLGTYAIGLFLLSVSVMSFHFARQGQSPTAMLFAGLQAIFWAGRALLEVLFPTHMQIFFLSHPASALGQHNRVRELCDGLHRLADIVTI